MKNFFELLNPNLTQIMSTEKKALIDLVNSKPLEFEYDSEAYCYHLDIEEEGVSLSIQFLYTADYDVCEGDYDTPSGAEITSEDITITYVNIWLEETDKDYDLTCDLEVSKLIEDNLIRL